MLTGIGHRGFVNRDSQHATRNRQPGAQDLKAAKRQRLRQVIDNLMASERADSEANVST
ncbi:MAG: hypothetical protein RLY70_1472 [Planctomycetota bacterium]|jgi:hypothetical protein